VCPEKVFDPFSNVRKKIFPAFLGKIVARNKNLLQGIIGFGRAILADTPELKGASFAPEEYSVNISKLISILRNFCKVKRIFLVRIHRMYKKTEPRFEIAPNFGYEQFSALDGAVPLNFLL
jgi:hypothetical protein